MFRSNSINLEGFNSILSIAMACQRGVSGCIASLRHAKVVASLDPRMQYDVGLSDRRPAASKSAGRSSYPSSVEAMLNRRY